MAVSVSVYRVVLLAVFPVVKMDLFVPVGHAGNEYKFTRLPTQWQSQINHLALLCNTDHRNQHRAYFTVLLCFCSVCRILEVLFDLVRFWQMVNVQVNIHLSKRKPGLLGTENP